MAKAKQAGKTQAAPPADPKGEDPKDKKGESELKVFDGLKLEDLAVVKQGIDEMRAYSNSAMNECIRLGNAFQQYHYLSRDGKLRDNEQDKRVKEGARARGAEAVRNLRLYLRRIEEELRGIQKTV